MTRVLECTEGFRQLLGNILTVNAGLVAQRQNDKLTRLSEAGYDQNEQVKRISSWAAILFAPNVIASIYGMNFTHIPELEWQLGYPFAIPAHAAARPRPLRNLQTLRLALSAHPAPGGCARATADS